MENLAVIAMKQMNEEDRQMCSRLVMKELAENGYVSENLCRTIVDFEMKKSDARIILINHFKNSNIEVI